MFPSVKALLGNWVFQCFKWMQYIWEFFPEKGLNELFDLLLARDGFLFERLLKKGDQAVLDLDSRVLSVIPKEKLLLVPGIIYDISHRNRNFMKELFDEETFTEKRHFIEYAVVDF